MVYHEVHVGPNFRVKVEDRSLPVKGLRVDIGGGIRAVTDKNGFAVFRRVRPGSYYLHVPLDDGISNSPILDVKQDGPAEVTVPIRWPSVAPILVRSLKGTIRRLDNPPGQPPTIRALDLFEGVSGRFVKSEKTTETGEFSFEPVSPGLYFLSLKPSGHDGQIAIVVDAGAALDHLDLDLGWTSCGLYYTDRNKCRQGDLQLDQFSGRVVDLSGAVIPGAKVLLLDPAGTQVEELHSDGEGKFAAPRPLEGPYELVVSGMGFSTYRRTVHAKPTGDSTRSSSLTIQLGILGNCGASRLE